MNDRRLQLALLATLGLYTVVVIRSAWLMDDSFITFRTVDNFINGYGLTWNTAERVQAYTNPLWMFAVSGAYFLTREIFYTPLCLSITVSVVVVAVVAWRIAATELAAILGLILLTNSKAFVDYSTSGLENPLTHLAMAMFAWQFFRVHCREARTADVRELLRLSLITSLAMVNRMDSLLLFLPALLYVASRHPRINAAKIILLGFVPFLVWELFSLFYYGFLFPNTAYAKLNTGLPRIELVGQGLYYLLDSATNDPLTLVIVSAGIIWPWTAGRTAGRAWTLGIVLYLLYVTAIGGDFMSGRFLSAPFLGGVIAIVSLDHRYTLKETSIAAAVALAISLASAHPPLISGADYGQEGVSSANGIGDERAAYYQGAGLLTAWRAEADAEYPDHPWARGAKAVRPAGNEYGAVVWANVGMTGFFGGPKLHIVDPIGLGDPLLARLPPYGVDEWAIGHMRRVIPEGYYETVLHWDNRIVDESLALYYDKLQVVTRGDLFNAERMREIWRFNTGAYDSLVNRKVYHNPPRVYRLISDAYEDPQNPSVQFELSWEHLRIGNTSKGMDALKAALRLKRETLIDRIKHPDFALDDWWRYLNQHLVLTSGGIISDRPTGPLAGAALLDDYDIFIHYTFIYEALRRDSYLSASGKEALARQFRDRATAHSTAVLAIQPNGLIFHSLGVGLMRNGQLREAALAFEKSINNTVDSNIRHQSHRDLVNVLKRLGRDEVAVSTLEAMLALEPEE